MTFTRTQLQGFWQLMRADKPIGIYLLLWPTLWALMLAAQGWPGWHLLLVFTLGVAIMRSAGCVINDYADRHVDGQVKRTAQRPLVSGAVTERQALGLFFVLISLAFALVLTLNWQTIVLSFVGLALASIYPFMKRVTYFPQFVLGAAFSWGIPMAYMATSEQVPMTAWIIYAANLVWTVAYDTQYAMVDRDDDLQIGVKSTAILFGRYDKLIIGGLQILTLLLIAAVFAISHLSWPAYLGLSVAAGLFIYQQILIAHRAREACFQAFLNNHYAGLAITLGLIFHYMM